LDGDDHIFFDSLLDAFPALIKLKLYANAMNNLDSRKVKSLLNLSHIKLSTYSGLFHCLQVLNLFRFLIDETSTRNHEYSGKLQAQIAESPRK
jgi:hypothetical protein